MKRVIIFFSLFLFVQFLSAQEVKLRVAVFDPSSSGTSIDEGTKVAVRELVSSTFVNTGKYTIVERSMLQQIMQEQKMSNTDAFDDSQATELGKLAGANKVVLSVVTLVGGRNMLSIKVIDVKTATIDQQKTKIVSTNDLLDVVEPLTSELLGISATPSQNNNLQNRSLEQKGNPKPESKPQKEEQPTGGGDVFLNFAGFSSKKDPVAKIIVDGVLIGSGTLNQGFSVSFSENRIGKHNVKIEWDSMITTKDFDIDTSFKKQFVFDYVKGGFGYEFKLK